MVAPNVAVLEYDDGGVCTFGGNLNALTDIADAEQLIGRQLANQWMRNRVASDLRAAADAARRTGRAESRTVLLRTHSGRAAVHAVVLIPRIGPDGQAHGVYALLFGPGFQIAQEDGRAWPLLGSSTDSKGAPNAPCADICPLLASTPNWREGA